MTDDSPDIVLTEVRDRLDAVCRRIDQFGGPVPWPIAKLRELLEPSRVELSGSAHATSDLFWRIEATISGYYRAASDVIGIDVPDDLTAEIHRLRQSCLLGRTLVEGFRPRHRV